MVLRGLTIKAVTVGSGIGIDHQSGTLFVESTVVVRGNAVDTFGTITTVALQ